MVAAVAIYSCGF